MFFLKLNYFKLSLSGLDTRIMLFYFHSKLAQLQKFLMQGFYAELDQYYLNLF